MLQGSRVLWPNHASAARFRGRLGVVLVCCNPSITSANSSSPYLASSCTLLAFLCKKPRGASRSNEAKEVFVHFFVFPDYIVVPYIRHSREASCFWVAFRSNPSSYLISVEVSNESRVFWLFCSYAFFTFCFIPCVSQYVLACLIILCFRCLL